jgi:hypothetical protein
MEIQNTHKFGTSEFFTKSSMFGLDVVARNKKISTFFTEEIKIKQIFF